MSDKETINVDTDNKENVFEEVNKETSKEESKEKEPKQKSNDTKQLAQKLRVPILVLNIIGTLSVLAQCVCSLLRSIDNIQSNKLQFMDVQVLIVSCLIGLVEILILLVVILKGKLRAKMMNWFTLTKSMHSYFVLQIMFSFIQGPQALFPAKTIESLPNPFYNIYNTLISCFLIIGWIFNVASYIIFIIGSINKKKQEKIAKKAGQTMPLIALY